MKKRLLPLSLLMILGLVACGPQAPSSEAPSSEETPSSSEEAPSSEETSSSEEAPSSEESSETPSSEEVEPLFLDVYFEAPETWATTINIYLWGNGGQFAAWPGTAMTHVEGSLYSFNYDVNTYPNVIFNDGTNQTADLQSPTDADLARYVVGEGWVVTTPEPEQTMAIANKDELTAEWHLGEEPRTINFAFDPAINVNGAILAGDLVITSSNEDAVVINGRAIQAIGVGEATITATYLDTLTDSFEVTVLEEIGMQVTELASIWAGLDDGTLKVGDEVRIQGIIVGTMEQSESHLYAGVYVQDGSVPMSLYTNFTQKVWEDLELEVGDAIDVIGKIDVYNGLTQVKPNAADGSIKKLDQHDLETPVALELTGDNFNNKDLAHEAGRLVYANRAVYVGGKIASATEHATINFKLAKEDGTFTDIGFRFNYHAGATAGAALKATIDALNPGDIVNLKGILGWFNSPQISPVFGADFTPEDCVEFVEAGQLPAPTTITVKGAQTVEVGAKITLTAEANEGADPSVEWSSSENAVATVDENGVVTGVGVGTTTITATSTKDSSVKGTLEVTVIASSEPETFAVTTLAEALENPAAELTQKFAISDVEVASWRYDDSTDGTDFGNFNITDGTTTILVYGATATASALTWDGTSYKYSNPKDFLTNDLTKQIAIGSKIDIQFVVTSYKGTKQLNVIVTKVDGEGEGNPSAPKATIAVTTLAEALENPAAELTQKFAISDVEVASWRYDDSTDGTDFGNFNITDGTTTILVYGATATASALKWDAENAKYVYTNAKDFLTNDLTKQIAIGSKIDIQFVVTSYKGTKQLNVIVTAVEDAVTPENPVDPEPEVPAGDTATFEWASCNQDSFSNAQAVYSHNGITITNDKAGYNNNLRDCKASGDRALRLYKASDVTISCEKEFTKVEITFDKGYDSETQYCLPAGTYGEATATLTGLEGTLTFDATTSLSLAGLPNQIRIISVTVYFA